MGRPKVHDEETLLDAAEQLLAENPASLTIRALAARTNAPTGSLYHAFGSRSELLARMWLRAANRFLDLQLEAIDAALGDGPTDRARAVEATVDASLTLSRLSAAHPATARLLFEHRRETLLGDDIPPELAADLGALDAALLKQMKRLARALTGRADRRSVELVTICIVDLPPAFLPRHRPRGLPIEPYLAAAVRGVLAEGA